MGKRRLQILFENAKGTYLKCTIKFRRKKCHTPEFKKFNLIPHLHSDLSKFNVKEKSHPRMVTKLLLKARYCVFNSKLFASIY